MSLTKENRRQLIKDTVDEDTLIEAAALANGATEEEAEKAVAAGGKSYGGVFGIGSKPATDVDAYLKSLEPTISSYRAAGYTDKEIASMMGLL